MGTCTVTYKGGNKKDYVCTGYKLQTHNFKSGPETALVLFKGQGKRPVPLKKANIETWTYKK
jgi:hypothetical protein